VSRELGVIRQEILYQLDGSVLVVLPMDLAGVAEINQKTNHDGLAALPGEEAYLLFLVVLEDVEVGLIQIRDKAPLFVADGDGNNDLIHLNANRRRLVLGLLIFGRRWSGDRNGRRRAVGSA